MSLNLADDNWMRKEEFKEKFKLSESTYQRRINKEMCNNPDYMRGYAKVSKTEVYINILVYQEFLNDKAQKMMSWVDY